MKPGLSVKFAPKASDINIKPSASRASSSATLHHPQLPSYQPTTTTTHTASTTHKGPYKDSKLSVPANLKMSESSLPIRSSPSQATPIPDDDHEADLPLTMTASVVLTSLPRDATAALKDAGAFDKPKGLLTPPIVCSAFLQSRSNGALQGHRVRAYPQAAGLPHQCDAAL